MSQKAIRYLTMEYLLVLHRAAIVDQRGDPHLRDRGLLDAALAMPPQQFGGEYLHPDIPAMAAAYAFHICRNHPFVDGNKRAAFGAMLAFLVDNGWSCDAQPDDAERTILELAAGDVSKEKLTDWVRGNSHEKPSMELREFFSALTYSRITEVLEAGLKDPDPQRSHAGRFATMSEAARAIPAINEANKGAMAARERGDQRGADILYAQSHLLTAIYSIAEEMGYEW